MMGRTWCCCPSPINNYLIQRSAWMMMRRCRSTQRVLWRKKELFLPRSLGPPHL
ncbi:hypothetical protein JOQ06_029110, partial [Pogonophryne albipinna]